MQSFHSSASLRNTIIAYAIEPPQFSARPSVSGFIEKIWRTHEIAALVVDGEQRSFTCVHIVGRMCDDSSPHNTRIFVEGSPITVDDMLQTLPRVPDHGVDFSGIAPTAMCLLMRPHAPSDVDRLHALKFTRLAI